MLKTDIKNSYNDDDFMEQNGEMKELMVTITLCEYRNLIQERCYNEKAIEELQEKNEALINQIEELNKSNKAYQTMLFKKAPEIKEKIREIAELLAEDIKTIYIKE